MDNKFAKVVIDIPHPSLDKTFEYIIPDEYKNKISAGVRVEVPFGVKNKAIDGYVMSVSDTCEWPLLRLKPITSFYNDDFVLLERFNARPN